MKYKAICFDADGMVLVPKRFSQEIQKDYNIPWAVMEAFFASPFQQCKVGKADLKEELSKVIEIWGWKGTVEELTAYWFNICSEVDMQMVGYIRSLRETGVLCYLTTNQEKYRVEFLRDQRDFRSLFDDIFVSAEIGYTKNSIKFFESFYKHLSVPKGEVLFCDNDSENIETAHEFGLETHLYKDFDSFAKVVNEL